MRISGATEPGAEPEMAAPFIPLTPCRPHPGMTCPFALADRYAGPSRSARAFPYAIGEVPKGGLPEARETRRPGASANQCGDRGFPGGRGEYGRSTFP